MKIILRRALILIQVLNLNGVPLFSAEENQANEVGLQAINVEADMVSLELSQLMPYDIYSLDNPSRLVIEIPETRYRVPFERKDVSSPLIRRIRGYQFKENPLISRVILDLKSPVNFKSDTEGNRVMVSLTKNVVAKEQTDSPKADSPRNVGNKRAKTVDLMESLPREVVTLDFEGADIKDVIRLMSETSNINMIFGPEVSGSISIHLRKVPFDEAFKTILNLRGLVATQLGSNILRITTPTILSSERSRAVTVTKTFPINYLKAQDMSTHIQSIIASSGRRGTISVVAESNSLVVTDSEEGLDQAARLIAQLDKRPKQVMIEARLVEIQLSNDTDIGVQWEYASLNASPGSTKFLGIRDEGGGARISQPFTSNTGVEASVGAIGPALGTGVNLPGPASAGVTFGFIKSNDVLSATLAALITQSRAKILSSPKVVTINGQEAKIEAVSQIPFRTSTVSGTGVVSNSFTNVDAGIVLSVTPTINSQDRVTLVIKPESSFPTQESTEAGPIIRTRNAQTTVIVKDGDTLVIGGLIDDRDTKGVEKVPLLGDIPIIGALFRRTTTSKERGELMVFVTPRIVRD